MGNKMLIESHKIISCVFLGGLVLGLFVLSSCQSPKTITTNTSNFLKESEIGNLSQKADAGDTDAAIKLSRYYGFWKFDVEQEIKWMTKAAENGDAGSQYNLGVFYSEGKFADLVKARFWFEKAKSNGVAEAKSKLNEIKFKQR